MSKRTSSHLRTATPDFLIEEANPVPGGNQLKLSKPDQDHGEVGGEMVPFAWLWVSMGDGEMGNEHWQGLDKLMKPSCANGKSNH